MAGLEANPAQEHVPKRRGKPKQLPGRNLALRCQQHRAAMLSPLELCVDVPFDNNQAERDIRMVCVKRKVSGGFRSETGGKRSAEFVVSFLPFRSRGYPFGMVQLMFFVTSYPKSTSQSDSYKTDNIIY